MKIEICKKCNGTGEITVDVGTHNSDYEIHKCPNCNGTGRLKTETFSYAVPFDMDDKKINIVSSAIINLIRELK